MGGVVFYSDIRGFLRWDFFSKMRAANALAVESVARNSLFTKGKQLLAASRMLPDVIAQFRYIKIQPKTIDLSTRLVGINPTNSVVIPTSLVLRSIVLG